MTKRAKTRAGTSSDRPSRPRADSIVTDAVEKYDFDHLSQIDWGEPKSTVHRRSESIELLDADVVEETEVPRIAPLTFAAFEGPAHVSAAQHAIIAFGHACPTAATGRPGLEEVQRALARGTIDAILVGLPGGEVLIEAARSLETRRPVIIASCAGAGRDVIERAVAAGADLVAFRPHDADRLAPILLAASRLREERDQAPSGIAERPAPEALQPFDLFQRVLDQELRRARRYTYPLAVALFAIEVPPPPPPPMVRGILRARAGNAVIQTIRDIDLATELDQERFLVLFPYTELTTASEVARRIVHAVGACDPVIMGGRSFPVRVTGAVAGARLGEPLSFARLMKDATRALDHARRDGAELAVQP